MHTAAKAVLLAALGLLTAMPALAVWNALAPDSRQIRFGRPIHGNAAVPGAMDLWGFVDGAFQKAVAAKAVDLIPARPLMIRLSNEIQFSLFRVSGAIPALLIGRDDFIVHRNYAASYCQIDLARDTAFVQEWVTRIKKIQDFYTGKGRRFVYVTSPSKFSLLNEKFRQKIPCQDSGRNQLLAFFAAELRAAGVNFVDGIGTTEQSQRTSGMASFASGGAHWSDDVVAQVTQKIIEVLNHPDPILPPLHWETRQVPTGVGSDVDYFLLMNLQRTEWRYPSRLVRYASGAECPVHLNEIALIGTSFSTAIAIALQQTGCMRRIAQYFYLNDLVAFTGSVVDGRIDVQRSVLASQMKYEHLLELRHADVVILEENEFTLAERSEQRGYAWQFYKLLFD